MNDKEKDEMLRAMFGEISQTIEEEADSKIHDAVCMEKFEDAAKLRDMRNHILGEIKRVFNSNGMTEDMPF